VNSERPRVARASIVSTAQARLSRAVLGYLALMIAIITLAPFRFAASPVRGFVTMWGLRDAVLNVVLFLPLGFVLQLGRPRGSPFAWGRALALGATFSGLIEVAQLFLPERFPSLADLATNALGAVLGALLAARATRRLDAAGTVRAFALDLPLVGLLYLFVPVLWLGGLSFDGRELLLLLLPVVSAGWIIASVHAAYSGSAHTARIRPLLQPALGGALFVAIGFLPAMPVAPMLAPAAAAVLALAVLARLRAPDSLTHERTASGGRSRRFEAPTLRAAMMPLLALIVGHALWPLDAPRAAWHGTLALLPFGVEPDDRGVFRIMAQVSAFAALGYAVAEQAGRTRTSLGALAPRVLLASALLAVPLEVARGLRAETASRALVAGFSIAAALFGAWLFVLQLANVRALLGREGPSAG
jgi:glycopeptide antibiotics resistance protein